ncbi:unnamed protein product [Ranitomeya imitator]|uniref:Uncharacterized protein n=1 Tax=Ranitomeya imitator TaxID=111125 RepID=A0ABN9LRM1_9NEOB|nr:unnamed protein product [Ranitomeya imitator]
MLQHIKRDVDVENSFIPDALQSRIQDPQKSLARNLVAHRGYLQTLQMENFVIEEYQSKAHLLERKADSTLLKVASKTDKGDASEFSTLQTKFECRRTITDRNLDFGFTDWNVTASYISEAAVFWSRPMASPFIAVHDDWTDPRAFA